MTDRAHPLFNRGAVALALVLMLAVAGCTKAGQFDPTEAFNSDVFDTKKKLKGDRVPVFPDGVPGATTGVPPDLVKGYQQPPDQPTDADDDQQAPGDEIVPIALPQLFELFAAYLFIDFLEYVGHGNVPALAPVPACLSMAWEVIPRGTRPSRFTHKTKVSSKAAAHLETLVPTSLMLWREQGKTAGSMRFLCVVWTH